MKVHVEGRVEPQVAVGGSLALCRWMNHPDYEHSEKIF